MWRRLADAQNEARLAASLESRQTHDIDEEDHRQALLQALHNLQEAAAYAQLDCELELHDTPPPPPPDQRPLATVCIACAHFLVELPLFYSKSPIGAPSLEHCSETAPIWTHATTRELTDELAQLATLGDATALCDSLDLLRASQERASVGKGAKEAEWRRARLALASTCGGVQGCCAGLRSVLYAQPNRSTAAMLGDVRTVTLREAAETAQGDGWLLSLQPPIEMEVEELCRTRALAGCDAASAASNEKPPQEPMLERLLHCYDPMAGEETLSSAAASRRVCFRVPLKDAPYDQHQLWHVQGSDAHVESVGSVRLDRLECLPAQLAALRRATVFSQVIASALAEPLLQRVEKGTDESPSGVSAGSASFRIDLQPLPPSSIRLLLLLPCTKDKVQGASLSMVRMCLQLGLEGEEGVDSAAPWSASFEGLDDGVTPIIPCTYAAALLNACHSLPLSLAMLRLRASELALDASAAASQGFGDGVAPVNDKPGGPKSQIAVRRSKRARNAS